MKCDFDYETATYFVVHDSGNESYLCDDCALTAEDIGYEVEYLELEEV